MCETRTEKRALVEMATQPGSSVPEVAACFEVAPSQLYAWRKQLADGELDDPVATPTFARVDVVPIAPPATAPAIGASAGKIIVAFPSGVRVRVVGSVDPAMLALVVAELDR
ncbi:MAG: transposase [Sphingomonadaceae bacterium]